MKITVEKNPLNFYDEETERAQVAQRAREEEIAEEDAYGRYGDNPFISKAKIFSITKSAYDNPDDLRLAREYDEKTRIRRRKTSRSTGNFGLDLLKAATFSPYEFKEGMGVLKTFFYLGRYKPGQDGPGKDGLSRTECERLSLHKRDIFWESIASWKFIKGTALNVIIIIATFLALRAIVPTLSFKHPMGILWAFILLMIFWNASKVFIKSILNVMEATYGTVMKRKEDTDKARKNAEAAQEKARKAAKDARKAREAEAQSDADNQSEETPTTNRFAGFFDGD